MKVQKIIIIYLISILFSNCGGIDSKYGCLGASSPVDLTIVNSGNTDLIVSLFDHSEKSGYNLIGTIKIKGHKEKIVCIDNEGPVTDGLYIYCYDRTYKINLSNTETFRLDLTDSTYLIPKISELEYLRDPKW